MPKFKKSEKREAVHYFFAPLLVTRYFRLPLLSKMTNIPCSTLRHWRCSYVRGFPSLFQALDYAENQHIPSIVDEYSQMMKVVIASLMYRMESELSCDVSGLVNNTILGSRSDFHGLSSEVLSSPYLSALLAKDTFACSCQSVTEISLDSGEAEQDMLMELLFD